MGSYNTPEKLKKKLPKSIMNSLGDFATSFLEAAEIEWIDLEKMGGKDKLPRTFYLANISLNQAIKDIKTMKPEACPPLKEFVKKEIII